MPGVRHLLFRLMMRKSLLLPLLALSFLTVPLAAQTKESSLIFTHVTVIDVVSGQAKPDVAVIVEGARITALGESGKVKVPQGAQVIDASGKFLIPGLWDMHVHLVEPRKHDTYLPLLIANGVTGVREMGSSSNEDDFFQPFYVLRQWRKEAAEGVLLVPRIFSAGLIVDGVWCLNCILARDEMEGRQVVRILKDSGADFVKVYDFLKRDVYFAIMDEAKKQGVPVVGHVPHSITVAEASDAGQKSVEHLTDIMWACSTAEAELRKSFDEVRDKRDPKKAFSALWGEQLNTLLSTYSKDKEKDLFARFRRNGTWQVPTLVTNWRYSSDKEPDFRNDPRLRYIPTHTKEHWAKETSSEPNPRVRAIYRKDAEIVGALNRAHVPLLAGTDLGVPTYVYPGFSLHDELAPGWAREALEVAEPKSLGDTFERVWFNGRRLK